MVCRDVVVLMQVVDMVLNVLLEGVVEARINEAVELVYVGDDDD